MSDTEVSGVAAQTRTARIPMDVAKRVAECISNCEFSIDSAYVATAEYAMLMPSIRGQARMPFGAPQDAMTRATEALALLAQAREAIKSSHKDLDILARSGGLDPRTVSSFPWEKGGPGG